jgi:FixJ family two-component response regulator
MERQPSQSNPTVPRSTRIASIDRQPAMETGQRGRVIAIVDDDTAVREEIESLLRSAGYTAKVFGSAEEFLESRHENNTVCLILDVDLPGMNGIELQTHLSRSVDIVFVSGITDNNGLTKAQALCGGAVAFLRKPFSDDDLLRAVRTSFNWG